MGMHRSALKRRRRTDAADTKARNRVQKVQERARRDARMLEKIKAGTLPFTSPVMSWLSATLGKRSSRITADDLKGLIT